MPRPEFPHWAQRQTLEARAAAAIRALADRPQVHFEAGRPWDGMRALPDTAPHLQAQAELSDLPAYRGLADALAQRLLHSDAALHEHLCPTDDAVTALIFEWLEQWRVESLAPAHWPGMRHNLQARFTRWSSLLLGSGLAETNTGLLLLCFAQVGWSRLSNTAIPEALEDLMEPVRLIIGPVLAEPLMRLRALRRDQAAYAFVALALARELADWFEDLHPGGTDGPASRRIGFSIAIPSSQATEQSLGAALGQALAQTPAQTAYGVWSRQYDRTRDAASLVRPALLQEYRDQLDRELANQSWSLGRLVRAIRQALEEPQARDFLFGQDEGLIDGRRLAQLVSSPDKHAVFYRDRLAAVTHARVALLIDCSGSMKRHGLQLALMMDMLGRAFERAEIPYEMLGFTTQSWNGGRPARDWSRQGRKDGYPGRLNELEHLVFRSFQMSRQQGRSGLAAIMKPDLFREGIDGEAVQWACERLLAEPGAARRVLWVISDGGPMDSATARANPPGLLDAHLRQVVRHGMTQQGIEILGIGVGQDLSAYYPRSVALNLDNGLDMHSLLALIRTLAGPPPEPM